MSMEWSAKLDNQVSAGAREAADDLRALRSEIGGVQAELAKLSSTRPGGVLGAAFTGPVSPGAGQTIGQATATKSPWENLAGKGGAAKAKAMLDGEGPAKAGEAGAASLAKATKASSGLKDGLKGVDKAGGLAKGALLAIGVAAGVAGVGGLARLAIGYQGVARLQAISYRASLDMRALFKGVDSSPLLRAAERFEKNLSRSTVTGNALSGIMTRGFNGFFSMLERAEPYITAMGQGALIAALYMEQGWLRARIALYPLTSAIGEWIGEENAMETAAAAGGLALAALGVYAAASALAFAPLVAAVTAVSAAIQQISKLMGELDENSFGEAQRQWWKITGQVSDESEEQRILNKASTNAASREAADKRKAKPPVPAPSDVGGAGKLTGQALGDGIVAGMAGSEAAVKAAGGKLADAANKGVRDKAEIHSPSRVMKQNARYMGQGVEQGLDESAPGVQAAADRSLVPDVGNGGAGTPRLNLGGMSGGGITIANVTIAPTFPNVSGGNPSDIASAMLDIAPALGQAIFRDVARQLGIPVEATT